MKPQQNKLLSLFLLLFFCSHSILQAGSCPCCTFQSIFRVTNNDSQIASKPCCQNKSTSETRTACCTTQEHLKQSCPLGESSQPCDNPGDCACCIQLPSHPTASHVWEKSTLAVAYLHVEVPFVFASLTKIIGAIPEVSPPPLIRRLAMLSFWRN